MPERRLYLYRKGEPPLVATEGNAPALELEGWARTPHGFFDIRGAGINIEDPQAVQMVGEILQKTADLANGSLNLELMTLRELKSFGEDHFGLKLKGYSSKKPIISRIKGELYGHSELLN